MLRGLRDPLWRARLDRKTTYYGGIAGAFSIKEEALESGYNSNYSDEQGFPRQVLRRGGVDQVPLPSGFSHIRPGSLDRPAARWKRIQRILGAGASDYEFFGMKVPVSAETRAKATWYTPTTEGAVNYDFTVPIFAKNRLTGRSLHVGFVPSIGPKEQTLETLLPALEGVPAKKPFPMAVSGLGTAPWFFKEERAHAALSAYPASQRSVYFERVFRDKGWMPFLKQYGKHLAVGGAAIGVGALLLSRLATPGRSERTRAQPRGEKFADQMAYGQAGMGEPLNEMAMLDAPRHWAVGFEGSWLSGAWRRFREVVLPAQTSIEVMEKLGARIVDDVPAAYAPDLRLARGRARHYDLQTQGIYGTERYEPGYLEIKTHLERKRATGIGLLPPETLRRKRALFKDELKRKKSMIRHNPYADQILYNPEVIEQMSREIPAIKNPSTAFHEMVEQAEAHVSHGKRLLKYSHGGGHATLRVVHDEFRAAQLYDAHHGTKTLDLALSLREMELHNLDQHIGMDPSLFPYPETTKRYIQRTRQTINIFRKGYNVLDELIKRKGNVARYFPEGWAEGLRIHQETSRVGAFAARGPEHFRSFVESLERGTKSWHFSKRLRQRRDLFALADLTEVASGEDQFSLSGGLMQRRAGRFMQIALRSSERDLQAVRKTIPSLRGGRRRAAERYVSSLGEAIRRQRGGESFFESFYGASIAKVVNPRQERFAHGLGIGGSFRSLDKNYNDAIQRAAKQRNVLADLSHDNFYELEKKRAYLAREKKPKRGRPRTPPSTSQTTVSEVCTACEGSGRYVYRNKGGKRTGRTGVCFRCAAKGFQTPKDVARNARFDSRNTNLSRLNEIEGIRKPRSQYHVVEGIRGEGMKKDLHDDLTAFGSGFSWLKGKGLFDRLKRFTSFLSEKIQHKVDRILNFGESVFHSVGRRTGWSYAENFKFSERFRKNAWKYYLAYESISTPTQLYLASKAVGIHRKKGKDTQREANRIEGIRKEGMKAGLHRELTDAGSPMSDGVRKRLLEMVRVSYGATKSVKKTASELGLSVGYVWKSLKKLGIPLEGHKTRGMGSSSGLSARNLLESSAEDLQKKILLSYERTQSSIATANELGIAPTSVLRHLKSVGAKIAPVGRPSSRLAEAWAALDRSALSAGVGRGKGRGITVAPDSVLFRDFIDAVDELQALKVPMEKVAERVKVSRQTLYDLRNLRIEGMRQPESAWGFEGMSSGPLSKELKKKLTDFGSGRHAERQLSAGAKRLLMTSSVGDFLRALQRDAVEIGRGAYGKTYRSHIQGAPFVAKEHHTFLDIAAAEWGALSSSRLAEGARPNRLFIEDEFESAVSQSLGEARILQRLKGVKGVPDFYGHDPLSGMVFMEHLEGGPVGASDLVNASKEKRISAIRQLYATTLQMGRRGIFHTDLHSGNVLIDKGGAINIVDFGMTRQVGRLDKMSLTPSTFRPDNIAASLGLGDEFAGEIQEAVNLYGWRYGANLPSQTRGVNQRTFLYLRQDRFSGRMSMGRAGTGKPLNEIEILNQPRHGDFSGGSWQKKAWDLAQRGRAGLCEALHATAQASGIRSQRRRLARLPNTNARAGVPKTHVNKSRAGAR